MAPPFNINNTSPGDSSLINAFPADERSNRTLIEDWLSWISDPATGNIRSSVLPATADPIPTGTKMLFVQTSAPSGWVKDVTHNDKALRVVNGSVVNGGSATFSSVFASRTPAGSIGNTTSTGSISSVSVTGTTDNTTQGGSIGNTTDTGTVGGTALTAANLPAHTHNYSGTTSTDGDHTHSTKTGAPNGGANLAEASGNNNYASEGHIQNAGAHSHTFSGTTDGGTGAGTTHTHSLTMNAHNHTYTGIAHNHTFTSNTHNHTLTMNAHNHSFTGTVMDFAVAYVDVIIATKS